MSMKRGKSQTKKFESTSENMLHFVEAIQRRDKMANVDTTYKEQDKNDIFGSIFCLVHILSLSFCGSRHLPCIEKENGKLKKKRFILLFVYVNLFLRFVPQNEYKKGVFVTCVVLFVTVCMYWLAITLNFENYVFIGCL